MIEESVHNTNANNSKDDASVENKHKIFVLYFEGLDRVGIPYGIGELVRKANELGLPVPSRKEAKSWKRKYVR